MKPFFYYYGGKYRAAPLYPPPRYGTIVEPFAGSAGYSVRYPSADVRLYDASPLIVGLWSYLIRTPAEEIMRLPAVVEHVDDVEGPEEARWLVGFWLNRGTSRPRKSPSAWMLSSVRPDSDWGEVIRCRIACQVDRIRHWKVACCDYSRIPRFAATWFVDPPYVGFAGRHYEKNVDDYAHLGSWCRSLEGQVVVCEQEGADWLPFSFLAETKSNESASGGKKSREVVWTNDEFLRGG